MVIGIRNAELKETIPKKEHIMSRKMSPIELLNRLKRFALSVLEIADKLP